MSDAVRRYHSDRSIVNKSIKVAVRGAGTTERMTAHTSRHSFAIHLLQPGTTIRTIQALLSKVVSTTMRYCHVLEQGLGSPESPRRTRPLN